VNPTAFPEDSYPADAGISGDVYQSDAIEVDTQEIEAVYETSFERLVDNSGASSNLNAMIHEQPSNKCAITAFLGTITLNLGMFCGWLRTLPQNAKPYLTKDSESPMSPTGRIVCDSDGCFVFVPVEAPSSNVQEERVTLSKPKRHDVFEDIRITIPIVKPPSWREVQHIAHRMPVTFDERGVKETMTVKMNRWEGFVDRQKEKIEKEINDMLEVKAREQIGSTFEDTQDEPEREQEPLDDDIIELQRMSERMNDWKDLTRYSGKSISMASTRRGNDMKIHVMAFAEREDGMGVDFIRLSYKKSVEVREMSREIQATTGVRSTLRHLLPFFSSDSYDDDDSRQGWIELLQQPDIAKFTIALAFRGALENDGVYLEFCESRLDGLD